jgi:hypothetical protein
MLWYLELQTDCTSRQTLSHLPNFRFFALGGMAPRIHSIRFCSRPTLPRPALRRAGRAACSSMPSSTTHTGHRVQRHTPPHPEGCGRRRTTTPPERWGPSGVPLRHTRRTSAARAHRRGPLLLSNNIARPRRDSDATPPARFDGLARCAGAVGHGDKSHEGRSDWSSYCMSRQSFFSRGYLVPV